MSDRDLKVLVVWRNRIVCLTLIYKVSEIEEAKKEALKKLRCEEA